MKNKAPTFQTFQRLMNKLNMGDLKEEPQALKGGALHSMWKITTSTGVFAIKHLNPHITAESDFKQNYELSEKIATGMSSAQIPAVNSLSFNARHVIQQEDDFYIIYPFIIGLILDETKLTSKHLEKIGYLFRLIHQTNLQILEVDRAHYDYFTNEYWSELVSRSVQTKLKKLLPSIIRWNTLYKSTIPELNNELVITHRDMHSQNILWDLNSEPHIIDWESAGLMNPMLEIIGYGLEWSGILLHQKVNTDFFRVLTKGYFKSPNTKWVTSVEQGFIGWLGHCVLAWTEFNIRRMLGDISSDSSEIEKGQNIIIDKMVPCLEYIENHETYLLDMINLID